ncbi:hypothetical protein [Kribbella ginsengisoli]|uniref:Uncharacterized protein n=1 Tax=Kribbella ginsengisoli TaxID=363865 RepID=A0ABP6WGU9_9ACTN
MDSVAAQDGRCTPPPASSPAYYDFVSTYRAACATRQNWDRAFDDVTVSSLVDGRNRLAVTSSAALAGAVASVSVNGKEFIASGGYGSAFQYAFHGWGNGKQASECYNPTQAGARIDSDGQAPPFHAKSSTSALYTFEHEGAATIRTEQRPAMYMTWADQHAGYDGCHGADLQPARSPYTQGLSPYWLRTRVALAPDHGLATNVIRLSADLTSEDTVQDNFDGVLVAYLQRDFVNVYSYDPATNKLVKRAPESYASNLPLMRCTADGGYCLGMLLPPAAREAGAYYYAQTRPPAPYNAMLGEANLQVTYQTTTALNAGDRLTYDLYVAIGNRARVASTLAALTKKLS